MKVWLGLIGSIIGLSVLLCIFAIKAPFMFVFAWTAFIVGVPVLWDKYGAGSVEAFWKNKIKMSIKIIAVLFLFFLIRAYFSYIVEFTPFSSYATWIKTTAVSNILGYTPGKLLYEGVFLLIVGLGAIEAVFGGSKQKTAQRSIGAFLIACFLLQTFVLGSSEVANAAGQPLKGKKVAIAVQKSGLLGGIAKQSWQAMFGKSNPKAGPPPRDTQWMTWRVTTQKVKLIRVYNGDWFEYKSPKGFWITHENGNRFYHNPSSKQGKIREFPFSEMPSQGGIISIHGEGAFDLSFRIVRER